MIHELKTDPIVFAESWRGDKPYEIRFDDRGFKTGDILILRETVDSGEDMKRRGTPVFYTGRQVTRYVTNKTTGYGLKDGWCTMGVRTV